MVKILRRKTTAAGVVFLFAILTIAIAFICIVHSSVGSKDNETVLLIDHDDTADSVRIKINANPIGWSLLQTVKPFTPRPGRYVIRPHDNLLDIYQRIRNRQQTPIDITLPIFRDILPFSRRLPQFFLADSTEFYQALTDPVLIDSLGFTRETWLAMFIPNTYQVWWTVSPRDFVIRMHKEYNRYWTPKRKALAKSLGLTPIQVSTLASIVDAETANIQEKPLVARMYLNRLNKRMPLQADPTVIFATGDFTIRRVLHKHLAIQSPYNTYKVRGLPPGPIRTPSLSALEAVLHPARHNYLYMCAKEDFSGTHNFAATYSEHLVNARRYVKALNQKGIKK